MTNIQVKIKGATNLLDLYILDCNIDCIIPKYEKCYNKDGNFIGTIETGTINKNITLEDIVGSLYYKDSSVYSEFPFIQALKLTYNCNDIYAIYRLGRINSTELSIERHVFEEILRFNDDMESIIYEDSIKCFDNIKEGIVLRSVSNSVMTANFFIEESIKSEKRCNYRKLNDRVALLNWDKIKHIKHNRLILDEDDLTIKRMIKFLINRLNQKSTITTTLQQRINLIRRVA